MNKRLFVILFLSLLLTTSGSLALAKDSNGDQGDDDKIEAEDIDEDDVDELEAEDADDEFEITLSPVAGIFSLSSGSTPTPSPKIEIKGNEFEITGTISSISGNTLVVGGQTIMIDISQVNKFEQKGVLSTGNTVRVEGVIVNGTKFAKEIKVFGANGQEVKIEIKNTPTGAKIEAKGPLDQIIFFLKQILGIT